MKRVGITVLVATLASGAWAANVKSDYDGEADFSGYETFAWKDASRDTPNPLAAKRISESLEGAFQARGFSMADPETADFLVDFDATITEELHIDENWFGVRRRRGWVREIDVTTYPVGTLAVIVIDRATQEVVWRGVASGAIVENREKMRKKIDKAVAKMLKGFPPS